MNILFFCLMIFIGLTSLPLWERHPLRAVFLLLTIFALFIVGLMIGYRIGIEHAIFQNI